MLNGAMIYDDMALKLNISQPPWPIPKPRVASGKFRASLAGWQIQRTASYIATHISERLTIEVLARHVRLSPGHFARAFKASFQLAPGTYIRNYRIEVSKKLLSEDQLPLVAIAIDCGFCDQAHFSRVFRSTVGETPGRWRRKAAHVRGYH